MIYNHLYLSRLYYLCHRIGYHDIYPLICITEFYFKKTNEPYELARKNLKSAFFPSPALVSLFKTEENSIACVLNLCLVGKRELF